MKIMPISKSSNLDKNASSFKAGLYFAKTPYILFNKKASIDYSRYNPFKNTILKSKEGFRYIKDDSTASDLRETIANTPFIKELSEEYDTFVVCHKPCFVDSLKKYGAAIEIFWADYSKEYAQHKAVVANSLISEDNAVANMLGNLRRREFVDFWTKK